MPNTQDSHPMNKTCIDAFNRIRVRDSEADAILVGLSAQVEAMRRELKALSGNGSKGKIDMLNDRVNSLEKYDATAEVGVSAEFREIRHEIQDLRGTVRALSDSVNTNAKEMRAMFKSWTNRLVTLGGLMIAAAGGVGFIVRYLGG